MFTLIRWFARRNPTLTGWLLIILAFWLMIFCFYWLDTDQAHWAALEMVAVITVGCLFVDDDMRRKEDNKE